MAEAGWYPDAYDPQAQHYFDGENWTGHRRPAVPSPPEPASDAEQTVRRGDLPGWGQGTGRGTGQGQAGQDAAWNQGGQPGSGQGGQPGWGHGADTGWGQGGWGAAGGSGAPQQPGPAATGGDPADQQGSGSWHPPAPPPARRNRAPLVVGGVLVAAAVAGLITYVAWPGDDAPAITYQGREVAAPADPLSAAETAVVSAVDERRGAKTDETRCYYARPKTPAADAKASDVENSLRCGPVLFVDGEKSASYLKVPVTADPSGSQVRLTVPGDVTDLDPEPLGDVDLVRPDGQTAPADDGGLDVPQPPAAGKDVLTVAPVNSAAAPSTLDGAVMVGKYTRVTVTRAGEIERFGSGDDARSAPEGQKLLAFRIEYGQGDVGDLANNDAKLVVDGGTPRDLPTVTGDDYIIAAVPLTGTAVVTLADSGFDQQLSLPDGTPGKNNIAVLRRSGRVGYIGKSVSVPIALRRGSQTGTATFRARATITSLDFWAPGNTSIHPTRPDRAILSVRLNYTDSLAPGKTFGFDPAVVRLKLPGNVYAKARNIAPKGKVSNVFEVPANFTAGVVQIIGSTTVKGITLRVTSPKGFVVRFPK